MSFIKRLIQGKIDQVKDWQNPDREEFPMPCEEIVLDGIDKDLYAKLLTQANAGGIQFQGDTATLHDGPISLGFLWNYDEPSATLRITCVKKPFIFSCGTVELQLRQLVEKAKESI